MNIEIINHICLEHFHILPEQIDRCTVGQGNYVYRITCENSAYIIRLSSEKDPYESSARWLAILSDLSIPVPKVIAKGSHLDFSYLILSYIDGDDIGNVYTQLNTDEKQLIAKEIVQIQNKVSSLTLDKPVSDWSWRKYFVDYMLDRAYQRIRQNGYFDVKKVEQLRKESKKLSDYFQSIKPVPYLDDISSKNLLIHKGKISGIIDIDEIGVGDMLTYVALSNMAFLYEGYDSDYVNFILEEMNLHPVKEKAFLFYSLIYCVDFMGERGMTFLDKKIHVDNEVISKLNCIYDNLWQQWLQMEV